MPSALLGKVAISNRVDKWRQALTSVPQTPRRLPKGCIFRPRKQFSHFRIVFDARGIPFHSHGGTLIGLFLALSHREGDDGKSLLAISAIMRLASALPVSAQAGWVPLIPVKVHS